jgi:hypothetical protein
MKWPGKCPAFCLREAAQATNVAGSRIAGSVFVSGSGAT